MAVQVNNMKPIVIINGSGGVGKDTFIELCDKADKLEVLNVSTVDSVKKAGYVLGYRYLKTDKDREFLSKLKQLSIDYYDHPFQHMKNLVRTFRNGGWDIMFIHCREIPEIERMVKEFNAITLLIESDRVPKITSNTSDALIADYKYDHVISNNGTLEQLEQVAKFFMDVVLPS